MALYRKCVVEYCDHALLFRGAWANLPLRDTAVQRSWLFHTREAKRTAIMTTPTSCANESYAFEHYFYHGSIGYFAFYEEAAGTYCKRDKTAYVRVRGLGTFDSNFSALASDRGDYSYRQSYWYGIFGCCGYCIASSSFVKATFCATDLG
ncbi:hypothetical protein GQ600_9191 [Phytophthora cactorum]|nr:hypothetical protein GQ600_9191 [Phytophthora cactorum]